MSIGGMGRRLTLQRRADGVNAWEDIEERWAQVQYLPNDDAISTARRRAKALIRYMPDIRVREVRAVYMGDAYSILNINNVDERDRYLELFLYLAPPFADGICAFYAPAWTADSAGVEQPVPVKRLEIPFDEAVVTAEEWYASKARDIALARRIMTPRDLRILPGDAALIGEEQYEAANVEHTEYEEGTPVTYVTLAQTDRTYDFNG